MAVSACANLQWLGAAVIFVPRATMALVPQVVKVFACPVLPPVCDCSASSFWLSSF